MLVAVAIGAASWAVLRDDTTPRQQTSTPTQSSPSPTGRGAKPENALYFRDKYQNNSDQGACLQEYYAMYPQNKPENQVPGRSYSAAPCPGIPQ